jgi:hypothetical protein
MRLWKADDFVVPLHSQKSTTTHLQNTLAVQSTRRAYLHGLLDQKPAK